LKLRWKYDGKFKVGVVHVDSLKECEGVELKLHSILTSTLCGGEWSG